MTTTLEQTVRMAVALRYSSLRGEIQDTVAQIRGQRREKECREVLTRLEAEGVVSLGDHVSFRDPAQLHRSTLELVSHFPDILEKQLSTNNFFRQTNDARLKTYLNRPLEDGDLPSYAVNWARQFWVPPWDADFFFTRLPDTQARMLQSLRPSLWAHGIWDERFDRLLDLCDAETAKLYRLEAALARGHWKQAQELLDSAAQKKGYGAVLLFLQGQVTEAYPQFLKRFARRKEGQPALEPFVAVFARLAALRLNDLETVADPRLRSGLHLLDEFFVALSRFLRHDGGAKFPPWEAPGAGLEWCVLWALRDCLPTQLSPRPECEARLRASGLQIFLEQLGQPKHPWGRSVALREPWQLFLENLEKRGQASKVAAPTESPLADGHLVWEIGEGGIGAYFQGHESLTPVPLAILIQSPPACLSHADHKVLSRLVNRDMAQAARALIGHPHVLYRGQPARLSQIQQKLHLSRTAMGYLLELKPAFPRNAAYRLLERSSGVVDICFPNPFQSELQPLLEARLEIPLEAEEELRTSLLPWLDKFELIYAKGLSPLAQTVRGGELLARLVPRRSGLRLQWVWQLPGDGPTYSLGEAPERDALYWQGRLLQVERDLDKEREALEQLVESHPELPDEETLYPELDPALDLLRRLQEAQVPCQWPEGNPWRVRPEVDSQGFQIRAVSEADWFKIQGQVRVDESLVIDLGRTLELLRDCPGRYLRLNDHDYVELAQDLRRKMQALDELVEEHRDGLRLSPLAVPSLAELDLPLQSDDSFRITLEKFMAVGDYHAPLPTTLMADLRDYQVEGFRWLAQRAEAGVGACLADDMGLGKTLQALALFLHARAEGAHLVICPTSVVANWRDQALQFAPSLRPRLYEGKERAEILADLAPGDLVIAGYRMLLQDQGPLSQISWNAVLLDEAQFIKNPESKTARASYSLKARLRIATSGTPVENRLTELWSIFRFLNPGLLGSLASFRKRFETNMALQLNASQRHLKRLVAPFLLRRTKSQVLSELPPRTEIALQVELSSPERAIYEKLRREAEESLEKLGQRFHLLAHLTRMRQACCHPRLILDQAGLTSSKLDAFLELFHDLRAGHHRCLVFSQFTTLLDLLEVELKQQEIDFLRLDGSTPVQERRNRVEAFQQGQGELFLISLKAGGTGLNLTAADFVVHLDPWWNPAAEDQASDRAHRIGQTRPVTIYRLIAQDTIEEKVVRLHGQKRKLALDLLEGSDQPVGLSESELRDLLLS